MSDHGLKSLLDEMLSDPKAHLAAARTRELEPSPILASTTFTDVEELRALSAPELCKVLAASTRDDLLTVLSGASEGLRRQILISLAPESVRWLKQNLEYFDEPTRALLAAGRKQVVGVANRLLADGSIALPNPGDTSGRATSEEIEQIGEVIAGLLTLVQERGVGELRSVVSAGGDKMLDRGVELIRQGADEAALTAAMGAMAIELERAYARRLAVIREGVLALHRAEDPMAFRERLARIAG